jgi:hypothetical protein
MNLSPESSNVSRTGLAVYVLVCVIVFIAALFLRIRAAMNDLWLDEIWSLQLIRDLRSPLEVFTKIHFSNNHYLNSLFIYFCGQRGDWPGYRAPAVLAGSGTVILAWFIGLRRSKPTAVITSLIAAFSYVLILYSSEARGYGPLVFFCFLCFYALESFLQRPQWRMALLFCVSAILGFTAHLQFATFFVAASIWIFVGASRWRHKLSDVIKAVMLCCAAPALYFAALYIIDVRYLQIGGGTPTTLVKAYGSSLAWALGAPNTTKLQAIACIVAIICFLAGLWLLWRKEPQLSVFFAAVIAIIPITLVIIRQDDLLYVRFFIVGIAFLLLLIGITLGRLYSRGLLGKSLCVLFLLAYLVANSYHIATLFRYGRGQTREAIRFMVEHSSPQRIVTFGGDHDFRIPFVLNFYWNETAPGRASEYFGRGLWPSDGLDWIIRQKESFEPPVPPGDAFKDSFGNSYELARVFPTAPLSGLHWFVYHNRAR